MEPFSEKLAAQPGKGADLATLHWCQAVMMRTPLVSDSESLSFSLSYPLQCNFNTYYLVTSSDLFRCDIRHSLNKDWNCELIQISSCAFILSSEKAPLTLDRRLGMIITGCTKTYTLTDKPTVLLVA